MPRNITESDVKVSSLEIFSEFRHEKWIENSEGNAKK